MSLDSRRRPRSGRRAQAFVDLACPFCYLAAERIERAFSSLTWTPAATSALTRSQRDVAAVVAAAEARAEVLRMPLQWPERFPLETPAAMRAASLAVERGRGSEFILAAGRLAFAGGFDLEDPEILAEAAAAAQLDLDECLQAARDERRDQAIDAAGRRLLAAGAEELPALSVQRRLVTGERRISTFLLAGSPTDAAAS